MCHSTYRISDGHYTGEPIERKITHKNVPWIQDEKIYKHYESVFFFWCKRIFATLIAMCGKPQLVKIDGSKGWVNVGSNSWFAHDLPNVDLTLKALNLYGHLGDQRGFFNLKSS